MTEKKLSEKLEKLVDQISELSVLELSELVSALQEKLGVVRAECRVEHALDGRQVDGLGFHAEVVAVEQRGRRGQGQQQQDVAPTCGCHHREGNLLGAAGRVKLPRCAG